jgi:hypothetical protein
MMDRRRCLYPPFAFYLYNSNRESQDAGLDLCAAVLSLCMMKVLERSGKAFLGSCLHIPSSVCRTAEPFRFFSSSEASDFERFFFFDIPQQIRGFYFFIGNRRCVV